MFRNGIVRKTVSKRNKGKRLWDELCWRIGGDVRKEREGKRR